MKYILWIFVFVFIATCGGEADKPVTLMGGLFVTSSTDPQQAIVMNLNEQATLTPDKAKSGGVILLTFSGMLQGDSVELKQVDPKTKVVTGFTQLSDVVSVSGVTPVSVTYRPDGGYVPPADTPADQFPKPAIAIQVPQMKVGDTVSVTLNSNVVKGVDGSKVAGGTVSFKVQ